MGSLWQKKNVKVSLRGGGLGRASARTRFGRLNVLLEASQYFFSIF
jgi:hypothetical protein